MHDTNLINQSDSARCVSPLNYSVEDKPPASGETSRNIAQTTGGRSQSQNLLWAKILLVVWICAFIASLLFAVVNTGTIVRPSGLFCQLFEKSPPRNTTFCG